MKAYIFYVRAMISFNGGIALTLMIYSWLSPHWWMLNSRLYSRSPEIRVVGLGQMLEDDDPVDFFTVLYGTTEKPGMTMYNLKNRRNNICNDKQRVDKRTSGIDKLDLDLLRQIKVPCAGFAKSIPIPLAPSARLTHSSSVPLKDFKKTDADMRLEYECEDTMPDDQTMQCPFGYNICPKESLGQCQTNGMVWPQQACCVDTTKVGETMYDQKTTPTYVQVFGWALWKAERDPNWDDAVNAGESLWCSAREFRCDVLSRFVNGGRICMACLVGAAILTMAMLGLHWSGKRSEYSLIMCAMYCIIGGIVLYGHWANRSYVEETLSLSMTPLDEFGRPFIHPMVNYEDGLRSLMRTSGHTTKAEWQYYHANAHVDMMAKDPRHPEGFTSLWGAVLARTSGIFALLASLFSLELYCADKGFAPVASLLAAVAAVLLAPFYVMKNVIDNVLAPYPVLWVYPWQKLYPKAFTCGTWLPQPLDTIWDIGIMLPVHVIRALWDYVSCQDICSPQEKEVLRSKGIHNDRLQSLLCSRRSYFVMMAGLGLINFIFNAESVITLADGITHYRQAASQEVSYPWYQCARRHGDCNLDLPDLGALNLYLIDMLVKIYAIVEEGCSYVDVNKALIEWLGGFLSVICACFALAHWTNFAASRRFCLIGWFLMMLTPVLTSSFCENQYVDTKAVEDSIVQASVEIWDELRYFLEKKPCEQMEEYGKYAIKTASRSCSVVLATSWFMPPATVAACREYRRKYGDVAEGSMSQALENCEEAVRVFQETGPKDHKEVQEIVKQYTPRVLQTIQIVVGLRAGLMNVRGILPAVLSMVPALMQGGLMVKNLVPRQSLPSILLTLPWAFTTLFWSHYQLFYQLLYGHVFLIACLAMSFGPMVYYLYGKLYTIVQPMDDQQSITLTFRIWYYALIFALVLPYATMFVYIGWMNEFKQDVIWNATIGPYLTPSFKVIVSLISGTLSSYAYSLQAGIDWFVDEVVDHHICGTAPAVIATTRNPQEAEYLQQSLDTTLDVASIDEGTYVCGGLSDLRRLSPPTEGDWSMKVQVYSASLQHKDFATLDAFTAHVFREDRIPEVFAKARQSFFSVMENPPRSAFVWDLAAAQAAEAQATVRGPPQPVEMSARLPLPAASGGAPLLPTGSQWGVNPMQQQPMGPPPHGAPYPPSASISQPYGGTMTANRDAYGWGRPTSAPPLAAPAGPPPGSWRPPDSFSPSGGFVRTSVGRMPPRSWGHGSASYEQPPQLGIQTAPSAFSSVPRGVQPPPQACFSVSHGPGAQAPPGWGQMGAPPPQGAGPQSWGPPDQPMQHWGPPDQRMQQQQHWGPPGQQMQQHWGPPDQQMHAWPQQRPGY
uniref:Uncharacterized protein n=1 Tax=Alexandrium catenella TaxID=2925 RepID=A0A7S1QG83_ALECA